MDSIVTAIDSSVATDHVVKYHYLHRRPPISFSYGLFVGDAIVGVVTYGVPPSRHAQKSVCPNDPDAAIELNRLWVADEQPKNTASFFVSKTLKMLPPKIIFSYADTSVGHIGHVYRALNFNYAGWTDMDRKTARFDYIPTDPTKHSRDAFRIGYTEKVRRKPKIKYWTTTGSRIERKQLEVLCGWEKMCWKAEPPPMSHRRR